MRYVVGYAVYAITLTGLLFHMVPPQPAPEMEPLSAYTSADQQARLSVLDDYFALPCTVRVGALAADEIVLDSPEEFERLREQIGC